MKLGEDKRNDFVIETGNMFFKSNLLFGTCLKEIDIHNPNLSVHAIPTKKRHALLFI